MRVDKTRQSKTVKMVPVNVQRARKRACRERMRAMGLRRISIWVPDVTSPSIREEARRQSLLASQSPEDREILNFVEAVADFSDWT